MKNLILMVTMALLFTLGVSAQREIDFEEQVSYGVGLDSDSVNTFSAAVTATTEVYGNFDAGLGVGMTHYLTSSAETAFPAYIRGKYNVHHIEGLSIVGDIGWVIHNRSLVSGSLHASMGLGYNKECFGLPLGVSVAYSRQKFSGIPTQQVINAGINITL